MDVCLRRNGDSMKKNDILRGTITGYTSEGQGVCRLEGRAVFVKNALAGEEADVRILKASNTAVYGKIEKLISPSPERCEPACVSAASCGGCALMHMSYAEELRMKQARVDDALRRIGGLDLKTSCIHGSGQQLRYRNKAIYNVGTRNGEAVTGFYRRHTHEVVPCRECLIQAPYADKAAAVTRQWMERFRVPAYDERTGEGLVRRVFARYAFGTGQGQAVLVTAKEEVPHLENWTEMIREECPESRSVVLNVNGTRGNTVLGGRFRTLWGSDTIEEIICGLRFRLSPRSFCQINIPQAQRLYEKTLEFAGLSGAETALDLYCGTGTISLCLAAQAGRVIGAEIVPEAVEDARRNAAENGVNNAEFICADAGQAAAWLRERGTQADVAVVDPPRKGLAPDVIETLAGMGPHRIVYVSCDPGTLARDLKHFEGLGYRAEQAEAFDMFPRTSHVETVCCLYHQKKDFISVPYEPKNVE